MKSTVIMSVQFTFIDDLDPKYHEEVTRRFVELMKDYTNADDVMLLYSKIFTHEDETEAVG